MCITRKTLTTICTRMPQNTSTRRDISDLNLEDWYFPPTGPRYMHTY